MCVGSSAAGFGSIGRSCGGGLRLEGTGFRGGVVERGLDRLCARGRAKLGNAKGAAVSVARATWMVSVNLGARRRGIRVGVLSD